MKRAECVKKKKKITQRSDVTWKEDDVDQVLKAAHQARWQQLSAGGSGKPGVMLLSLFSFGRALCMCLYPHYVGPNPGGEETHELRLGKVSTIDQQADY